MDHAPGVGVGHRLADLLEDREEPRPVVRRVLAVLQQRGQGPAPDQLHRDVEPAVGKLAQLVDRDDPRVLELAADLRLLDEPADHLGVVAVLFQDDLDGQVAAEVDVAPLEDRAHPAAGDLAHELVAARIAGEVGHLRRAGPDELERRSATSRSRTRGTGPIDRSRVVRTPEAAERSVPDRGGAGIAAEPGRRVDRSFEPQSGRREVAPRPSRSRQCGQSPAGAFAGCFDAAVGADQSSATIPQTFLRTGLR